MTTRDATHVCVLTPSGRGAVAVVGVEGRAAVEAVGRFFQAVNGRALAEQPIARIVYGHWCKANETSAGEDLIVCRRSDDSLEIHCHGGQQSSAQIVGDLASAGCTLVDAQQWLASQHNCPLTAAAHLALGQATTDRTATILLDQYNGALHREIEAVLADLSDGQTDGVGARIEGMLQFAAFGKHLTTPWRVVIAGQPNVGKSSLINALVGFERAIVFDQPGTTRDVVSSTTAIEGWPVELSDTAGLHDTSDQIETAGIELARQRLLAADLIVWVLDARAVASADGSAAWSLVQQQATEVGVTLDQQQTLLVINKTDLADQFANQDAQCVCTSALNRQGIDQLLAALANRLVPNVPPHGAAVPFAKQQIERLEKALRAVGRKEFALATAKLCELLHVSDAALGR